MWIALFCDKLDSVDLRNRKKSLAADMTCLHSATPDTLEIADHVASVLFTPRTEAITISVAAFRKRICSCTFTRHFC